MAAACMLVFKGELLCLPAVPANQEHVPTAGPPDAHATESAHDIPMPFTPSCVQVPVEMIDYKDLQWGKFLGEGSGAPMSG